MVELYINNYTNFDREKKIKYINLFFSALGSCLEKIKALILLNDDDQNKLSLLDINKYQYGLIICK